MKLPHQLDVPNTMVKKSSRYLFVSIFACNCTQCPESALRTVKSGAYGLIVCSAAPGGTMGSFPPVISSTGRRRIDLSSGSSAVKSELLQHSCKKILHLPWKARWAIHTFLVHFIYVLHLSFVPIQRRPVTTIFGENPTVGRFFLPNS